MKISKLLVAGFVAFATLVSACTYDPKSGLPNTDDDLAAYTGNLQFQLAVSRPQFADRSVKITDFGGVGDGVTDNTAAFARAMQTLSQRGGGHLVVPGGVWYTGPITFEDNVDLHLEEGAIILFTENFDAYPIIETSFEGLDTRRCMSPLNAEGKTNIAITGFGTIDGNGDAWRWVKKSKLTDSQWQALLARGGCVNEAADIWFPTEAVRAAYEKADMNVVRGVESEEEWQALRDYLRPVLLSFRRCKNVLLEGVCFENSPAWNLHPFMCENIIINNVMVVNPWYSQNGDGLDLESCNNALIVNSKFDVGDDAICVKSGKDEDGRRRGVPCSNVVVDGCSVYHGHGGFVVGSEMSGGVQNVSVKNCTFLGTDVGLRFKSTRGRGGVVENIYIDNVQMINIPTECLLFDLYYSGKSASEMLAEGNDTPKDEVIPEVTEETPAFRNIYISRIACKNARRAMYFNGLPEMPITNINVTDARISSTLGVELCESDGVKLENVQVTVAEGPALSLTNVKNLVATGFEFDGAADQGLTVAGERAGEVTISSKSIAAAPKTIAVDEALVKIEE
jgi:polygalacturonase